MQSFIAIALNGFLELARQPIVLLLTTTSAVAIVFLSSIPYFGLGEDPKLVKDMVLAVMFLTGLFGAVLCASNTLAREIRTGTALAVLSKPVGRANFLLARYTGLVAVLTLTVFVNLLACLLASRLAFDSYGEADLRAVAVYFGSVLVAYLGAGFSNFFLRRAFVSDALVAMVATTTLAFVAINFFDHEGNSQPFAKGVDWRIVHAGLLVLFAIWMLAALALASSTRLEMVATLGVCTLFFLLGLMSDYLVGRPALEGRWWAQVLYAVLPNWQKFWLSDALVEGGAIPWSYVAKAFGYAATYTGAALAVGLTLFEDRELS
ncbi:MAG: ABC transporter permease [Verrucomicrobia bacterium]|nr:ABC transporter permease [Verrucomicrobiota bacterium]MBI3870826.1 ABC transporter permease [Verrucomicrobiota bacterium]